MYHAYKGYGRGPIDADAALGDDFTWDNFTEIEDYLVDIWDRYGSLAAWALRERTHREAPWKDTFDGTQNVQISDEAIRSYFAGHPL